MSHLAHFLRGVQSPFSMNGMHFLLFVCVCACIMIYLSQVSRDVIGKVVVVLEMHV